MSTTSLADLISNLKETFADRMDDINEGRNPSNAFDGPPLPLTNEYRVRVDRSEYKPSIKTGINQFVITYEVVEPVAYAGRKIQAYYSPNPTNEAAGRQLADLFAALKADLDTGWGDDYEGFAAQFVDRTAVITLNIWGTDNDRNGVRWINADRGQTLKTGITPPKAKTNTSNLRPDISIPKDPEPTPVQAPTAEEQPAVQAPLPGGLGGGSSKPGPNLPPGLK